MEDESGIELSLGLSCGGSSTKPKSKNGSSSDTRAEEAGRGGKMVDDFKSMFNTDPQKPESIAGTRRSDSSKPEENFFSDLSKVKEDNASLNLNGRGYLVANNNNNNKPIEIEENKRLEVVNKRRMSFDDIRNQKKHDSDVHHVDMHDRARTSHISLTEDGSTAENEDVADSEADNSTSRPLSHHSDGSKGFIRVGGASSDAPKEVRGVADSSANGQKRYTPSTEKDFKHANMNYSGASFSAQQVNMMMGVPYSTVKESNLVGGPNPQMPGVMHVMPTSTGERAGAQSVSNGSLPMMFGYSSVQLPMLDKDSSWGLASRPQQLHPSFAGRGPTNSGNFDLDGHYF